MTRRELFKEINAKCIELNNKYRINSGGCCYVAAVLAELLTQCDISYKVVYYFDGGCHYYIKVVDRYLNSDYCTKKSGIIRIYDSSYEDIYEKYYNNGWNDEYNIKYNGLVKISLMRIFNKYLNGQRRNNRKT